MTWITLHSSDVGAPALAGVDGSLVTLLDYALVTMGAGWTIAHTATNARVYQNALGNLFYVNHAAAASGTVSKAVVRGCEAATAASAAELVDPYPTVAQVAETQSNWTLTDGNSVATAREYRIIANENWVILLNRLTTASLNGWNLQFFGDFPTQFADVYASCVFVSNSIANSSTYGMNQPTQAYPQIATNIFFKRDISGAVKSSKGILGIAGALGGASGTTALRSGFGNRIFKKKLGIHCSGSSGAALGVTLIVDRVMLPHIWAPLHNGGYSASGISDIDEFRDDAYNPAAIFRVLSGTSYTNYAVVEITDTWTPNG